MAAKTSLRHDRCVFCACAFSRGVTSTISSGEQINAQNLWSDPLAHLSRAVALQGIQHSVRAHCRCRSTSPNAQCKAEWYIKLNPNARIPTIDDDGFIMWESGAINLYLAKKYKSPLWPRHYKARATLQWAFFIANDIEPPMIGVFQNRFVLPPERRDAGVASHGGEVAAAQAQGARRAAYRDAVLWRRSLGHGGLHGGERRCYEPRRR